MKEIDDTLRYYSDRARDYDRTAGYLDKEAEKIRAAMKQRHQAFVKNKNVLEIACGTGYWTNVIAETAGFVLASDASKKMISIAQEKYKTLANVTFKVCDAYSLANVSAMFNAAYAHWWWSHMPRSKIRDFLRVLHSKLLTGSQVLFSDHLSVYLDGDIDVTVNDDGDRIERRTLKNGKTYRVIKNFPTQQDIHNHLHGMAENIEFIEYDKYWELHYTVGVKSQH
jgi:SAM-dependent methyltransferase